MFYLRGGFTGLSGKAPRGQGLFFRARLDNLEERYVLDALPAFPGAYGFGALATGGAVPRALFLEVRLSNGWKA